MAIKQVTWAQAVVPNETLADWLAEKNFQPGKFVVMHEPFSRFVRVIYVKEER